MKVMIVGHGYVGSAVASIFDDEEKVIIDPKFNDNKISDFSEQKFDAVFVCVDTPKGNNTTLQFNMIQFIVKTVYMCTLTYIGVKIFNLNFKIFVPILCTTWFFFHIMEAFFTDSIIKKSIKS